MNDLEKICQYSAICPASDYGSNEDCKDKYNCKIYNSLISEEIDLLDRLEFRRE